MVMNDRRIDHEAEMDGVVSRARWGFVDTHVEFCAKFRSTFRIASSDLERRNNRILTF